MCPLTDVWWIQCWQHPLPPVQRLGRGAGCIFLAGCSSSGWVPGSQFLPHLGGRPRPHCPPHRTQVEPKAGRGDLRPTSQAVLPGGLASEGHSGALRGPSLCSQTPGPALGAPQLTFHKHTRWCKKAYNIFRKPGRVCQSRGTGRGTPGSLRSGERGPRAPSGSPRAGEEVQALLIRCPPRSLRSEV